MIGMLEYVKRANRLEELAEALEKELTAKQIHEAENFIKTFVPASGQN